jgi:hypothetical protein
MTMAIGRPFPQTDPKNTGMPKKSSSSIGIFAGSQLRQYGMGIPVSGPVLDC